ncbi:hypothetical protein PMAYCL1PPCAC_24680 [Pristionchus mayeri]|uniref:Uncharacterized protein n=1 Tax=Pristionchus mayeri TaxID=1317129 RepID=A0AAN5D1R2_9BILA|nr:hypothetical protein PMAYCL1PPCAC_24680 [Pristionchus mayeri]
MRRMILLAIAAAAVCLAAHLPASDLDSDDSAAPDSPALVEDQHTRVKRYYGYGYDYYGGDYWYAGRTIGVIVGVLLLLLCCCIPCICLAGIWFAGWFGIKAVRSKKHQQQGNISYIGSRGDTRGGGIGASHSSSSATAAASAAAATAHPISSPPEPAPRTTFAEEAQNHRSYTSDAYQPPPRRFESRRRNSDEFDVVFEAEDRFYSQSTHHSPRDTYPYRSSRF